MRISVKHDFDRFERALDDLRLKQLPFATVMALNDTAIAAQGKVTNALTLIFDRPVSFTRNAVGVQRATKATLTSVVFIKPIQAKYLLHEEIGGTRTAAENTRSVASALVMPNAIKLDAHGNIPSGAIKKLAAAAQADKSVQAARRAKAGRASASKKNKGIAYFKGQGPHGHGPGGFFMRTAAGGLQRLTGFEPAARYKPIFHFRDRVELAARQTFRTALMRRLREAIATAR